MAKNIFREYHIRRIFEQELNEQTVKSRMTSKLITTCEAIDKQTALNYQSILLEFIK